MLICPPPLDVISADLCAKASQLPLLFQRFLFCSLMYLLLPHISQLPLQRGHSHLRGRDERKRGVSGAGKKKKRRVKAVFTRDKHADRTEENRLKAMPQSLLIWS